MRGKLVIVRDLGELETIELSKLGPGYFSLSESGRLVATGAAMPTSGAKVVRIDWDVPTGAFRVTSTGYSLRVGDTQVVGDKPFLANRSCDIQIEGETVRLEIVHDNPRLDGKVIRRIEIAPNGSWEFGRGDGDKPKSGVTRIALDIESKRISGVHAVLSADGDDYVLQDMSRYGTYLNGERFTEQRLVYGDRFKIGEYVFEFLVNEVRRVDDELGGEIVAQGVGKKVTTKNPDTGRKELKSILSHVDLNIESGEFVGILGGSGQGKSTLMNCLCGIALPTEGEVLVNGVSIADRQALMKAGIGFVPQEDIVHRELTVSQALFYSARLKLRLSRAATWRQIESVMSKLGLDEHREKLVGRLSGGQRKRVSIAAELLARPRVLFLDEPSSGLDPATEFELMSLLQSLAATGMTVVCTTHVLENAHLFDRLLWVQGGWVVFSGNHRQAREFFLESGSDSVLESSTDPVTSMLGTAKLANLVRIYKSLADTKEAPEELEERFRDSRFYRQPEPGRRVDEEREKELQRPRVGFWRTLWYLIARQACILLSDPLNVIFLMAQAIVIALLIAWVADGPVLRGFLAIVATLWFGCSNGAQQIVGELPVFQRERVSGQGRNAYITSKIGFFSFVTLIQALFLLTTMLGSAGWFHPDDSVTGRDQQVTDLLRKKLFVVKQRTLTAEDEEKLLLGAFDDETPARVTPEGLLESPNLPGIFYAVADPSAWQAGKIFESPTGESLRLPAVLPTYRPPPFPARSARPGMVESPYAPGSWKVFGPLEKELWRSGQSVRCPLTGQSFTLPRRLPSWPDNTLRFRFTKALVVGLALEEVVLDSGAAQDNEEMRKRGIEPSPELSLSEALGWPTGLLIIAFISAAVVGVCLGLTISALVSSSTQAMMWVPLVLIPQILFGGFVVTYPEMTAPVRQVSRFVPSFACQRILDVSHIFGRLTPRTSNLSKMPVFLSGQRDQVEWQGPNGRKKRENYDRADDRNISWQNLLVLPDRVGKRIIEKTSEVIYDQKGALKRSHDIIPDTVAYRDDLRYGYIQGVRYHYIGEAQLSALVLVGWLVSCLGLIHLGLFQKERIK